MKIIVAVLGNVRLYIIIVVTYCYLERGIEKVSEFHLDNSSFFKISASPPLVLRSNKRCNLKLI